jgi:VWFA-related protein
MTRASLLAAMMMGAGLSAMVAKAGSVSTAQPAFRVGTSLIEVSAVVTSNGDTVTDLKPEDVEVLDNGVRQQLVAFEFVDLTSVAGPAQRRDFVLMLDDLHVHPRQTKAAQDVARAFVDALGPHDRLAVVNTSPHELVMQFSTDREQARKLISKFRGQMGPASRQMRDAAARIHLQVLRNVALAVKNTAAERRAVLVIGEGHPIEPPGDGRLEEPDARILEDFHDVLRQAAVANIAIYGINPTGLQPPSAHAPLSSGGRIDTGAGQTVAASVALDMTFRRYGSIGLLADSTGGTMTIDRNNLDADLPGLLQDSRRYYRLAYVQPDVPLEERNKERRIEVRVLRDHVQVRARKAYLPS